MPVDFEFAAGDTASILEETFASDAGAAIDLTGATVTLVLRHMATGATATRSMTVTSPATNGTAQYRFLAVDLQNDDGEFLLGGWWYQCRATLASGRIISVPNSQGDWKLLFLNPRVDA